MPEKKNDPPPAEPETQTEQVERNPAHPVEEDPREHYGEVIKDPWTDRTQKDWPANTSEDDFS